MATPAFAGREATPVQVVGSDGGARTFIAAGNVGVAAQITATLPAVAGRTTYLTGFYIDGLGATAGSVIEVTVSGTLGGSFTRKLTIPAGAAVAITPLSMAFETPIPSSAVNTAIVVTVPSFGAGNTNAIVRAWGYYE
jgi:hypothetical protein